MNLVEPVTLPSIKSPPLPTSTSANVASINEYIPIGCYRLSKTFDSITNHPNSHQFQAIESYSEISDALGPSFSCLLQAGWLRLMVRWDASKQVTYLRVFVLPDDIAQSSLKRTSRPLRNDLIRILGLLNHEDDGSNGPIFDHCASKMHSEDHSLWYLFNTLGSPNPDCERPAFQHEREAMVELLDRLGCAGGLKTKLYPFQARSAAKMIERETAPERYLDPRFEERTDQHGKPYYYSPVDTVFLSSPRQYETNRGGILAESMGHGKTLICLAIVCATKGHFPKFPVQHQQKRHVQNGPQSLSGLAISTMIRLSMPWTEMIKKYEQETDVDYSHLVKTAHDPVYVISPPQIRRNRNFSARPDREIRLCRGTIIVVPPQLFDQWKREITTHVQGGFLRILYMNDSKSELPPAQVLADYDIVLFGNKRFNMEIKDGQDEHGRRLLQGPRIACTCPYIGASREPDCTCFNANATYQSPLKKLHWLRIIVDEGHSFAKSNSAVVLAEELFAERRWVVSGTPAKGLVGVDLNQAMMESMDDFTKVEIRAAALEERKGFSKSSKKEEEDGAKALGKLASGFLKMHPWTPTSTTEATAKWTDYIYRRGDPTSRTFVGYSACLSRTLERLIIKTKPADVERDLDLPPLHHTTVYLEPSFYDKLTTNLFVQTIRGNAITSERSDEDYLFHKHNAKFRHLLIRNLRQANFAWTGISEEDVQSNLDNAKNYLKKENINCPPRDREALEESMSAIQLSLNSSTWKAMSHTHEIGLFVESWPEEYKGVWALDVSDSERLPVFGLERVYRAQIHINSQRDSLSLSPLEGFFRAGVKAEIQLNPPQKSLEKKPAIAKKGVPSSVLGNDTGSASNLSTSRGIPIKVKKHESPKKESPKKRKQVSDTQSVKRVKLSLDAGASEIQTNWNEASIPRARGILKKVNSNADPADEELFPEHIEALRQTRLLGTTSAKATYLIDKFVKHCPEEKMLVFFDCTTTARYIQTILDVLHIGSRHFARGMSKEQQSKNKDAFQTDHQIRVLLIDVKLGGEGLDLNAASIVLIVNPICQPTLEAQVIKRAHRIGQRRRVLVETLVLKGTVEEELFQRSKTMQYAEHQEGMAENTSYKEVLLNASIIPMSAEEGTAENAMAKLKAPQKLFLRDEYAAFEIDVDEEEKGQKRRPKKKLPENSLSGMATSRVSFRSPNPEESTTLSVIEEDSPSAQLYREADNFPLEPSNTFNGASSISQSIRIGDTSPAPYNQTLEKSNKTSKKSVAFSESQPTPEESSAPHPEAEVKADTIPDLPNQSSSVSSKPKTKKRKVMFAEPPPTQDADLHASSSRTAASAPQVTLPQQWVDPSLASHLASSFAPLSAYQSQACQGPSLASYDSPYTPATSTPLSQRGPSQASTAASGVPHPQTHPIPAPMLILAPRTPALTLPPRVMNSNSALMPSWKPLQNMRDGGQKQG